MLKRTFRIYKEFHLYLFIEVLVRAHITFEARFVSGDTWDIDTPFELPMDCFPRARWLRGSK